MTSRPVLRAAASTTPAALAESIAREFRADREVRAVDVEVIGNEAIARGVKAIAVARGQTIPQGFDLTIVPVFSDFENDGDHWHGMTLGIYRVAT